MTLESDFLLVGTTEADQDGGNAAGTGGRMLCLDAGSGKRLWEATHPFLGLPGHDRSGFGIRSRPTVDRDRVYYVSNRGELMCVDLRGFHDGENDGPYQNEQRRSVEAADVVWKRDLVAELDVLKMDGYGDGNPISSPLVVGDRVFCITGNGCTFLIGGQFGKELVPRPEAPSFLAVNRGSGEPVWSGSQPGTDVLYSWSSPLSGRIDGTAQIFFPGGDGRLYSFTPTTGRLLWSLDCNEPAATGWTRTRRGSRNFFVATPVIEGQTMYVGLNQDTEGLPDSAPLYSINLIKAANQQDNAINWKFENEDFQGTFSSAVVANGIVFTVSEVGGHLFALDQETGRELWRFHISDASSEGFTGPMAYDGLLYVPAANRIHVFQAGRRKRLVGEYRFASNLRGSPIIRRDLLFVTTSSHVMAAELVRFRE